MGAPRPRAARETGRCDDVRAPPRRAAGSGGLARERGRSAPARPRTATARLPWGAGRSPRWLLGSAQAELGRAGGPLAPAAAGLEHLGTLRLLRRRGLGGQARAADRLPRGHGELVQAVVEPV